MPHIQQKWKMQWKEPFSKNYFGKKKFLEKVNPVRSKIIIIFLYFSENIDNSQLWSFCDDSDKNNYAAETEKKIIRIQHYFETTIIHP